MADSLVYLEHMKPGSCEAVLSRLLHRLGRFRSYFLCFFFPHALVKITWEEFLCSSKESSLTGLQNLATTIFTKDPIVPAETGNASIDSKKMHHNEELSGNANLSPLAKFLLTRYVKLLCREF